MNKTFIILFISSLFSFVYPQNENFIRGVDLSFTPQIEEKGGLYKVNGTAADILDIFKGNGVNYVRLRIWHTPADGYCGLDKTVAFAKRIKAKGLKLLLDFHYSDTWADPGKQYKPAAWSSLTVEQLKDSIYSYSRNVIAALKNQNALPDMVQFGNEISNGMLWPEGKNDTPAGWNNLADLIKKGVAGLRDAASGTAVKIMLHIDCGGDNAKSIWWFDNIIARNVEFDVIGLSYYPWWHGTLTALQNNVNDLDSRYGKEVNIVETAYPWTLSWSDSETNIVGLSNQLHAGYPATVQGQYDFIKAVSNITANIPGGKRSGFFYWAPDWIVTGSSGSGWENMTFFDFNGEALNSISVFKPSNSAVQQDKSTPSTFQLGQNYPNPFNPSTKIKFTIPAGAYTKLEVYNLLGEKVEECISGYLPAGEYEVELGMGSLMSGVYLYRLMSGNYSVARKMILLK